MVSTDRLILRLLSLERTFTWEDLETLLGRLGYRRQEGRGSRVKFTNGNSRQLINLHRPHPGNELKRYARRQIIEKLEDGGLI
ncbi:type II toxin-antitoxin system HicA family toxin [Alloalcanivorax sp. C16-1]|uniref:type II toxin-antitoxin system HicA family toxin n=1 Tax=Alloalcanivorax sp. C16-1 TaxID=3390051 RepID=UPI0039705255